MISGVVRDRHRGVGLGDAVIDRPVLVVVVGTACEAPWIIVVRAGGSVRGVAYFNDFGRVLFLSVYTGDRVSRRVRKTGVGRAGTGVWRDHHRRIRLGNARSEERRVGKEGGTAWEAPRIIVIRDGVCVRGAAYVNGADSVLRLAVS